MYFTINLLPPEKKEALVAGLLITYIEAALLFLLILSGIFAVTLISLRFVLKGVESDLLVQQQQISTESETPQQEVRQMDLYVRSVDSVQLGFVRWSDVLLDISSAIPEGTALSSITVNAEGLIAINGTAPTRDDVLALKTSLESLEYFESIASPLSNIYQRTNVEFSFEAQYPVQLDE